ncbi:MAG: HAMP domain-containing histidine kinase, partial [Candidatus Obscuribacterales bacterium]|nr:HAMP domain-containing histidine kinase [Candidatus Obscuribacterales bacterium]
MKLTIATKGIVLVAVPLIFELVFVGVLVGTLKQSEGEIARELKYQSIIQNLSMVSRGMVSASSNMGNSDPSESEERFEVEQERTYASMKKLNKMVATEPVLLANWDVFSKSVKIVFENMHEYSKLSFDELIQRLSDDPEAIRHLQAEIDLLSSRAGNLVMQTRSMEQNLPNNDQQLAALNRNLSVSLLANIAIAIVLAVAFGFDIARRLKKLAENTSRVSRNLPPLPSLGGNDEIAQLDMIIHKMANDLHEADTQRKKLLSIVRLRLQNPLVVARESLSALIVEDKEITDLARKWMGKAISQLGRLESLLNDLTNLDSQIESSQIELKLAQMSTEKIVASSIDAVQSLANKKEVKLSQAGPDLLCQADGERITQVIINFLSNALKFSPVGASVQVFVVDKDSQLEIVVKDEGPGVPAEMQSKIFERYEQTSREDATAKGGAGLGLNICKLIVQAHNGEIGVTSEPAKGSSFYLRLPKKGPLETKATNISSLSRSVSAQTATSSLAVRDKKPFFKTRIWHKGLIVVSVPLIFQLAFVFQLTNLLSQA